MALGYLTHDPLRLGDDNFERLIQYPFFFKKKKKKTISYLSYVVYLVIEIKLLIVLVKSNYLSCADNSFAIREMAYDRTTMGPF